MTVALFFWMTSLKINRFTVTVVGIPGWKKNE